MDANGALPAAMNSPATTESTPERNRSNAGTVTGVSPARTIWHCTWNGMPKSVEREVGVGVKEEAQQEVDYPWHPD